MVHPWAQATSVSRTRTEPVTIIYDGDCGFCQWSAERLGKRFPENSYRMVARQRAMNLGIDPLMLEEGRAKVLLLTPEGKMLSGHIAVMKVMEVTGWGSFARLLVKPPFGWILRAGYRLVAQNRQLISKVFFKNQVCRLDK